MESPLSLSSFFASSQPPALRLAHLITALDADLIGKIAHLTKAKVGLWCVPAPFDELDIYDRARESAPLAAWALPANQAEVLSFGLYLQEAVFGVKLLFIDAEFDEPALAGIAAITGERLETGAYITHGFEDLAELPRLVELCHWVLIPIGPDRSQALFVTSQAKADWISKMQEWCEREGRNLTQFRANNGTTVLVNRPAPEPFRTNAVNHCVDAFLGKMEMYFGGADESILPVVEKRLQARRQLRSDLRRVRRKDSSAD